jgi:Rha family phage regulatory protein
MSENTTDLIELAVTNGQPTTTSLAIAERFGKQHKNVLQSIERLECPKEFVELNFQPVAYKGGNGELRPMYAVTKDGFMFLAMGFTGKEAAAWKVRFIAAFNAMERQLLENAAAQQIPKPDGTLFLSHSADIMVAADRIFRGTIRSSRSAGLNLPAALRRANAVTLERTGIDMLHTLQAEDHLAELDAQHAQATHADAAGAPGAAAQRMAQEPVARFLRDWMDGVLGLPYQACQTKQAYLAYQHWCQAAQVRFASSQGEFTGRLLRYASAMGHSLRQHVVRLHAHTDQEMMARVLITHGLPLDAPIGEWASEQVTQFQAHLQTYCGHNHLVEAM